MILVNWNKNQETERERFSEEPLQEQPWEGTELLPRGAARHWVAGRSAAPRRVSGVKTLPLQLFCFAVMLYYNIFIFYYYAFTAIPLSV